MVELITFPYVSELIFNQLDTKTICNCRVVCRSWRECIDEQRFLWARMFPKYIKIYLGRHSRLWYSSCAYPDNEKGFLYKKIS